MVAKRKEIFIVVLGILVLAAVWIAVLKPSIDFKKIVPFRGRKKVARVTSSVFDKRADYLALIASTRQIKSPFVYSSLGRRDPMMSLVKSRRRVVRGGRRPPKLSLQGIIWSESEPEAVINGTILKENDSIKGVKVLQINRDSVTFIYQSREFVLRLE